MNYYDIHTHVLPAMDDGSKSMEQSLAMLQIAWEEGTGTIIATPHNMPGKGCPKKAEVEKRVKKLQETAENENIPIRILCGTEYFYREEVLEILEAGEGITMAGSDCVLVEFDPGVEKIYVRNAVREVLALGYTPVVAHVERYFSLMEKDFQTITEMKKMGALIQVNCSSIMGSLGWKTKRNTKKLLKLRLVDFVATDAHSDGTRAPRMRECAEFLYKKCPADYAEALLGKNAVRYFQCED